MIWFILLYLIYLVLFFISTLLFARAGFIQSLAIVMALLWPISFMALGIYEVVEAGNKEK